MGYDLKAIEAPMPERLVTLVGKFVTSTNGEIASSDCVGCRVAIVAAEAGRYLITLFEGATKLYYGHAVVEGAADAAAPAAKGVVAKLRTNNVAVTGGGTVLLQFVTPALAAGAEVDVDVEDGATVRFMLVVSRGKV